MPTIKGGTYKFSEVPTLPENEIYQNLTFISDSFSAIRATSEAIYYVLSDNSELLAWSQDSGWSSDSSLGIDGARYVNIILEQTVESEFYNWFMATAERSVATLSYRGATLKQLFAGTRAVLACGGLKMAGDLEISIGKDIGGGSNSALDAAIDEQCALIEELQASLADKTSGSIGGNCSGSHIVEVEELPTSSIDQTAIYKLKRPTFKDLIITNYENSDLTLSVKDVFQFLLGAQLNLTFNYCVDRPSVDDVKVTDVANSNEIHFYYIKNEAAVYMYGQIESDADPEWLNLADILNEGVDVEGGDPEYVFGGEIENIADADSYNTYYVIVSDSDNIYYTYNQNDVGFKQVLFKYGDEFMLSLDLYLMLYMNAQVRYYHAKTFADADIHETDLNTSNILHVYYIEEAADTDLFLHIDGEWCTVESEFWYEYLGEVSSISEAYLKYYNTDSWNAGYIAIVSDGWTRHVEPESTMIITDNGFYDVSSAAGITVDVDSGSDWYPSGTLYVYENGWYNVYDYSDISVEVDQTSSANVASSYIVERFSDLPYEAPSGSFAIILEE